MWPWEHLAVGYLAYSLSVHLFGRRAPGGAPVAALAVGTHFPDLVDKPLSWTLGILPTGQSLAHSALVAVPFSGVAILVAWALGRTRVGVAFAFGYLSHLPGDVIYPVLVGGEPNYDFLLWPLVPAAETATNVGFVTMFRRLFARYVTELGRSEVSAYFALELGLLASVFLLWLYDGVPPLRAAWTWVGRRAGRSPSGSDAREETP